ncbi:hypothetical protein [Brevundimonas sp.]|uniref:hypothetical protein n=1 Tax=Brevundimonas sp. TaxID=1871086 RepID=UPI003F72A19C
MLMLMLALIADPTTEPGPLVTLPSAEQMEDWQARCQGSVLQQANIIPAPATTSTSSALQTAVVIRPESPPTRTGDLLYRQGETVRLYLTLERRINGCSAPLFTEVNSFGPEED